MKKVLIIDDDPLFAAVLARRFAKFNWQTLTASNPDDALDLTESSLHSILLDLNIDGESSLPFIPRLKARWSSANLIMMTGYASITTTVEAIKLGADNYLSKPIDFKILLKEIEGSSTKDLRIDQPISVEALEYEYIQLVLKQHQGNVSATARALGMHRRTLQRKLLKKSTL